MSYLINLHCIKEILLILLNLRCHDILFDVSFSVSFLFFMVNVSNYLCYVTMWHICWFSGRDDVPLMGFIYYFLFLIMLQSACDVEVEKFERAFLLQLLSSSSSNSNKEVLLSLLSLLICYLKVDYLLYVLIKVANSIYLWKLTELLTAKH